MSHTAAPGTAGGSSPGGRLARRLLPAAVVVALLLEWIQWAGEQAGWYSSATSILLFAGATAVIFASLILTGARWINRLDRERRQAEIDARDVVHQTAEHAAFLAALVSTSDEAIVGASLDGTIRSWNAGAERLCGYTASEIVGCSTRILVPPNSTDSMEEIRGRLDRGDVIRGFETTRLHKDGTIIDVSLTFSPIRDDANQIVGVSTVAREIGARKLAEAALRGAVQFHQQTVNSLGEGLVVYDRNLRFIVFNPAMERLTGRRAHDVIGAHPSELASDFASRPLSKVLERALAGESVRSEEGELYRPEGMEPRWVTHEHVPLRSAEGEIIGVIGTWRDVTARKHADEQLRIQAVRLRMLADASEAFAAVGQDYQTLLDEVALKVSEALADSVYIRLLSEDGERLDLAAMYAVDPEVSEAVRAIAGEWALPSSDPGMVPTVLRSGEPAYLPMMTGEQLRAATPPQLWPLYQRFATHSAIVVPLQIQGRGIGVLSLARYRRERPSFVSDDVRLAQDLASRAALAINGARLFREVQRELADRMQAEQLLRDLRDRTAFALQSAGVGIWDMDYGTGVLQWSPVLEAQYGLQPGTFGGTFEAFVELIHPDDRAPMLESFGKAVKSGVDFTVQHRTLGPAGEVRWLSGAGRVLLGEHDEPLRGVGISMDVTERRTLEQQFQQAQKMEAVGQLAGGVAHDFNNLLTAILGFSNFVIETFDADDERRGDLEQVIKAGDRATALTRQLLAFSRKQVLQSVDVDLNELVAGVRQMLSRLIGEQIKLATVLAPNLRSIRADPGQLEQIVMNLVVNARDAMPLGGRVAIETANVELDESYALHHHPVRPGSYVMLAVSDAGVGMSEEVKRRLFEPFFTTKEPGKGTGLGLATVYGIVKQSGGYIFVYSEPGAGTTFKIYLPVADREQGAPIPDADDDVAPRGSETVLVVEDEEAVRFLTRVILEKAGYQVVEAPNPLEAEALFVANPMRFDLVVTDVIMPGSSGPKLFERLSQIRSDLKVLYVSGYTDDEIVHRGQLDPGVEFLQKPFTAAELSRRVRAVIDR